MIKKDIQGTDLNLFKTGNPVKRLLKISLDLLNARQVGILFGTNGTGTRFLPAASWDQGHIDCLYGNGFRGLVLRFFGTAIVRAKKLSPVYFYKQGTGPDKQDNEGIIAYILRNADDYYRKGISVFICPDIQEHLTGAEGCRYVDIPFYCYNGTCVTMPEERIKLDTEIVKHFDARNYISITIPNYGILVLNTVGETLLENDKTGFVNETELTLRLDILISLVESASLDSLRKLNSTSAAELLLGKEKHLRKASSELAENERKFRDLYENAPVAFFTISRDGTILNCNNMGRNLLGYDPEDLVGRSAASLFSDRNDIPRFLDISWETEQGNHDIRSSEARLRTRDNRDIWINLSVDAVRDRAGRILEFRATANDISRRKQAEKQLLESEKRFRELAEMLPEAVFETDENLGIVFANQRAFQLFGYSDEDLQKGLNGLDFIAPEDRQRSTLNMAKRLKNGTSGTIEYKALRKDGSTFPALFNTSSIISDGRMCGHRGIVIDITDRKHLENRCLESNEELRRLNEHLLCLEESQKSGIASDLHDSVIQTLGMCVSKIKTLRENKPGPGLQDLGTVQTFLEQSLKELRSMIFDLSPPVLHSFDIGTALGCLMEETNKRYRAWIAYTNRFTHPVIMDSVMKVAVYRATSELILNVIKHSGTKEADVELWGDNDQLYIRVEDAGAGFDVSSLAKQKDKQGFGLYSLSERMKRFGGDVEIHSRPGQGTRVILRVCTASGRKLPVF
ncbi:MAG: PAS domain S-box protein [Pseudomonadota bacterium]